MRSCRASYPLNSILKNGHFIGLAISDEQYLQKWSSSGTSSVLHHNVSADHSHCQEAIEE